MSDDGDALLRGGTVVFLGLAASLGGGFLVRLAMARSLGRVGYGAIVVGIAVLTMAKTVVSLGLHTGVARYLPRSSDPAHRRGVVVSALQVAMPLAVATGLATAAGAGPLARLVFHDPAIAPVLRVFGIAIPFAVLLAIAVGTVQGLQRTLPKALSDVTLPVVQLALVGGAAAAGATAVAVAGGYVAGYVVLGVAAGVYLLRRTPLTADVSARPIRRELVAFSVPLMVSSVAVSMFSNIDVVMVGYFASTGDVGLYSAMYSLSNLLTVVPFAIGYVYMPRVSERHAEGGGFEDAYRTATSVTAVATVPVFAVVALLPGFVIGVSFGGDFVAGAAALRVLAVGYLVHAVAGPNMRTLTSIGHGRAIMGINLAALALDVALNAVLIPRYGFLGAAVATSVSYVALNVLYGAALYRATGIVPRPSPTVAYRAVTDLRR